MPMNDEVKGVLEDSWKWDKTRDPSLLPDGVRVRMRSELERDLAVQIVKELRIYTDIINAAAPKCFVEDPVVEGQVWAGKWRGGYVWTERDPKEEDTWVVYQELHEGLLTTLDGFTARLITGRIRAGDTALPDVGVTAAPTRLLNINQYAFTLQWVGVDPDKVEGLKAGKNTTATITDPKHRELQNPANDPDTAGAEVTIAGNYVQVAITHEIAEDGSATVDWQLIAQGYAVDFPRNKDGSGAVLVRVYEDVWAPTFQALVNSWKANDNFVDAQIVGYHRDTHSMDLLTEWKSGAGGTCGGLPSDTAPFLTEDNNRRARWEKQYNHIRTLPADPVADLTGGRRELKKTIRDRGDGTKDVEHAIIEHRNQRVMKTYTTRYGTGTRIWAVNQDLTQLTADIALMTDATQNSFEVQNIELNTLFSYSIHMAPIPTGQKAGGIDGDDTDNDALVNPLHIQSEDKHEQVRRLEYNDIMDAGAVVAALPALVGATMTRDINIQDGRDGRGDVVVTDRKLKPEKIDRTFPTIYGLGRIIVGYNQPEATLIADIGIIALHTSPPRIEQVPTATGVLFNYTLITVPRKSSGSPDDWDSVSKADQKKLVIQTQRSGGVDQWREILITYDYTQTTSGNTAQDAYNKGIEPWSLKENVGTDYYKVERAKKVEIGAWQNIAAPQTINAPS